ncbi:hypothetical protein NNO_1702 [Hydrogenimonas sp.]|nr:hypothetical protein NNO_1702 [Hydrogenimonas sp.]
MDLFSWYDTDMKREVLILSTIFALSLKAAVITPWHIEPDRYAEIPRFKILDAKEIESKDDEKGDFSGVSGIAYDRAEKRLYAVSDFGVLYSVKMKISGGKIVKFDIKNKVRLKDAKGRPFKDKKRSDAEGLDISGGNLLISFERGPGIALFDRDGRMIKELKLPKPLRKKSNYRGRNRMLEAVVFHPRLGILTAPEIPLKKEDRNRHTIYGKKVRFHMPATGSLTAMAVTKKGNILVLERDFDPLFRRRVITLSLLNPENGEIRLLASLKSRDGWRLDNFEGLAHLGGDRFLMISDDNANPLQRKIAVLFEIME